MESYSFPKKKSICSSKRLKSIKICPRISKGYKTNEDLISEKEERELDFLDDNGQVSGSLLSANSCLDSPTQVLPESPASPTSPISPTSPKTPVSPISLASPSLQSYAPFDPLYLHTSERERLDNFDFNSSSQKQRATSLQNPAIATSWSNIPSRKFSYQGSPTASHARPVSSTVANRSLFRRSGSTTLKQTPATDPLQTPLGLLTSSKRHSYSRQTSVSSKNSLFDYNDSVSVGSPMSTFSSGQVFKRGSRAAISGNKLGHRRSFSRSSTMTSIELDTLISKKSLEEIHIKEPVNEVYNNNRDASLGCADNFAGPHKSHENLEEYTYNRYTHDTSDNFVKQLANLDFESSMKLSNSLDSDLCVNATKHTDEKLSTPRVFYILENPIASLIDLDIVGSE